jgi:hypothetical protein
MGKLFLGAALYVTVPNIALAKHGARSAVPLFRPACVYEEKKLPSAVKFLIMA